MMQRKRRFKLSPLPRIKVKIGTHKDGCVHCLFGSYGKEACPTQYDGDGKYIPGQPFYCWISGWLHDPNYKERWNRDLKRHFWNYIRYNAHRIHPADLAK